MTEDLIRYQARIKSFLMRHGIEVPKAKFKDAKALDPKKLLDTPVLDWILEYEFPESPTSENTWPFPSIFKVLFPPTVKYAPSIPKLIGIT